MSKGMALAFVLSPALPNISLDKLFEDTTARFSTFEEDVRQGERT